MKMNEIIELLKEQLRLANETVSSLTIHAGEFTERIESLEKMLVKKGVAIDKAQCQNKVLGKLMSGKYARNADMLENIYKAIKQVVLQQFYVTTDETYYKVLQMRTKTTDNDSKKGYLWRSVLQSLGCLYCK